MANATKVIQKGLSNKKDYLLHKLQNGMKCLLISQPKNEFKTEMCESRHSKSSIDCSNDYDEESTDGSSCSDNETKTQSNAFAMSLCVSVGSFSDPVPVQGLAHLLEHMISMGSEQYPADNHFDKFLNRKSGYSNAETGCEYTLFHFEVPIEYSREAVNIFASMFQAPKLAKESIDKEKQVVDSEFQMVITNDDVRLQRFVQFSIMLNLIK